MVCGGCFEFCSRERLDDSSKAPAKPAQGAILVLVGMRGAGKTTLSLVAGRSLKRQVLDLDHVLEQQVLKCKIKEFVDRNGWPAFRAKEAELLQDVVLRGEFINDRRAGCVVATGGGVVETPESVELLRRHSPVVWIDRHIDDIMLCLEGDGSYRPGLGEPPRDIYKRRRPLYETCSDFQFTMRRGADNWELINRRFEHFATWTENRGRMPASLVCVPIVASSVAAAVDDLREAAAEGAGLAELRLDLIAGGLQAVTEGLPALMIAAKRYGLPVVATCRAQWEDRSAGYSGPEPPRMEVLRQAARLGAHYVDVERGAMKEWTAAGGLPAGSFTQLVVSSHNFERVLEDKELSALFAGMRELAGPQGVVKIAQMPANSLEAARMLGLLSGANGRSSAGGAVSLAMGEAGVFTRTLAPVFSRTRFSFGCLLGRASAPGQLTALEMVDALHLCRLSPQTQAFGLLQAGTFSCRLSGIVNAGLAAAGLNAVCSPIPVRGCTADELLAALPRGTLAKTYIEDSEVAAVEAAASPSVDELVEQARKLYAHFTGKRAPPQAALTAMEAAAKKIASAFALA